MRILTIKNIEKNYGKKSVIKNISLEIKQGQVIGLLGPNGAGKTTCFYIIVGLVAVDSGNIFLDGVDITKMAMHVRSKFGIGYLPQESSIFKKMIKYIFLL